VETAAGVVRPDLLLAASALVALAACGESWKKLETYPIGSQPIPIVVSEAAGTGPKVARGALVQVEVEILEPSGVFKESRTGDKRTAWVWAGAAVMKGGHLGSEAARLLLVDRPVGTQLTVDAKTRRAGEKNAPNYGGPHVLDRPFANHKASIVIHDTVYRMRILEACPAEAWAADVRRTSFGFESGCKGDFIPTSCSPSLWQSTTFTRFRITSTCNGEKLDFRSRVPGDPGE
jgi:hypothetical protein